MSFQRSMRSAITTARSSSNVNAAASSSRLFASTSPYGAVISSTSSSSPSAPVRPSDESTKFLDFPKLKIHKPTHNIHVATLHLRSHHPTSLDLFTNFALHSASSLKIPTSRIASLPTTTTLITVPKSPFVHKKAQENFNVKHHKRVIKVFDTDKEVLDLWLRYLRINGIGGVGIKAYVFDHVEFGFGSKELGDVELALEEGAGGAKIGEAAEGLKRELIGESSEATPIGEGGKVLEAQKE